jgi:ATP/ADP translocase/HEAT repeat protein
MSLAEKAASLVGVEPGEVRSTSLMLAHSFAMGLSTVFFETAAAALFLAHFGSEALPYVYITAAVLNTLTGLVYSSVQHRIPFDRLMRGTLVLLLASVVGLRLGIALTGAGWIYFGLLVWYRAVSALSDLEYWAVATRLYDVRQAKRLFGFIGTGEVVARIAGSFSVPLILKLTPVSNLILLSAAALSVCLWLLVRILPLSPAVAPTRQSARDKARGGGLRQFARLLTNSYLLGLFAVIVFGVLAKYFVDYAFLAQLKTRYTDASELASFFGVFSGLTQVLSLLTRVFVSGPLIERHGIRFGLLVLPAAHVICTALVIADSALFGKLGMLFWLVIANQGLYKVLKHPIDNPSFKVLYQPLRSDQRLAAQIAVETMVTPITTGLAGALMLIFTVVIAYTPVRFALVMLATFVGWLFVARRAGREYGAALVRALRGRLVHDGAFSFGDERSVAVLHETLKSDAAAEVIFALDLLEKSGHERLAADLASVIDHPSAAVRRAAMLRLARTQAAAALPVVTRRLGVEPEPAVREAGLRAIAALGGAAAAPQLLPWLENPDPATRAAAVLGLLRHGDESASSAARRGLEAMAASPLAPVRVAAAQAIGESGGPEATALLGALLSDRDTPVRRAALLAAGRLADPALLPVVIDSLPDLAVGGAAAAALIAAGTVALPALEAAFEHAPRAGLRVALARVLGRIRSERARRFLSGHRAYPHEAIRTEVLEALRLNGYAAAPEEVADIESDVRREVEDAAATLAARRDLGAAPEWSLLSGALESEVNRNRQRIFLLLSFLYDPRAMLRAHENLTHPAKDRRAYAFEILDVILPREMKALVMPLIEEIPLEERLARLSLWFPQPVASPEGRVREILELPQGWATAWTRAAALYAVGQTRGAGFLHLLHALARVPEPLVSETARWAHARLSGPPLETNGRSRMLTLERVIILKSVDMFVGTSEQVLADIAAILEEVDVKRGELIFKKGDLGDSLYIIVDGKVRVFDGATTIGTLGERDIFGELALLDPEPRSASTAALEDTQLFRLDREAFTELMAGNIEIVRGVLHVLCERLRQEIKEDFAAGQGK